MSTKSLEGLRDYLCDTLSTGNMLWLCQQLSDYAHNHQKEEEEDLKPYTLEELHQSILESEKEFAEGKFKTIEEVFEGLGEPFDIDNEMREAV